MPFVSSGGTLVEVGRPGLSITPSGIRTYTGLTAAYESIYRSQPNVRFVVDFVARNIADLPIRLMHRVSERERKHVRDHPFDRFLRNPSALATRYELIRDLVTDLLVFDNLYGLKVNTGARRNLVRYPPRQIEPVGTKLFPVGYRLLDVAGQPIWGTEDVVHLHGYNPDGEPTGVSPIETLRQVLAEDIAASEYREQFWANHARTSAVIERPVDAPKWSPTARERFEAGFSATWSGRGPGAGGTPVLEEGMTLNTGATQTAQESEYLGARKLTKAECAAAYFMAPAMVGIMDNTNFSNMDIQHRMLYQDGLGPTLTFLGLGFWLQLLPDFASDAEREDFEVEFQIEHKLRGSFVEESEAMTRAVGGPWMLRAEGRAKAGLPPLDEEEGAEHLIVPLNVVTGGRPNPIDTTLPSDPPAPPGQLGRRRGRKAQVLEIPAMNGPGWVTQHEDTIGHFLERQSASVLSRLGAGELPTEAWDTARWDDELANDLFGLALAMAPEAAEPIAERFDVEYAVDVAEPWLEQNARKAAEGFNAATLERLVDVFATGGDGTRSRKADELEVDDAGEDEVSPVVLAGAIFAAARDSRAAAFALDRATTVTNFARQDVASQAGATTKTWHTPAARPRATHAALNGVTIPAGDRFSNGGLWPHDPALGADEAAGCTCYVDFTEAPLTEELGT